MPMRRSSMSSMMLSRSNALVASVPMRGKRCRWSPSESGMDIFKILFRQLAKKDRLPRQQVSKGKTRAVMECLLGDLRRELPPH